MRLICIVLSSIASIIAIVLAALPLYKLAFIPAIIALVFGLIAFYLSKKQNESKKMIQLIVLLTIIALALTTYKTVFEKTEVGNTEALELREDEAKENAIEELDDIEIIE